MPSRSASSCACVDLAVRAHAIAPQPPGRRQLERAREPAVIGEQQQAFGGEIEPADADQARQVLRQRAERWSAGPADRRAWSPARAACDRGTAACARAPGSGLPSTTIRSRARHVERGRGDLLAVDRDAPGRDPRLGLAPRGKPGARDDLGDALAGRCDRFRALPYRARCSRDLMPQVGGFDG